MDYYCSENVSWQWQGDEYVLQNDVNFDLSKCGSNDISITQIEPDIDIMSGENTPVKSCGEVLDHFNDYDIMAKTTQESEESSPPLKRRRMLNFDDVDEDILSSSLKSKERIDIIDEYLSEIPWWEGCLQDDSTCPLSFEDLSQSEAWLADCLDVTNMNANSNDGNAFVVPDFQFGKTEVCSNRPDSAISLTQQPVGNPINVVFRGRKGYMSAPPKQDSSIVYPFEFIKPSWICGDMTLKDINHRIRTPPPSKPKQAEEDTPISAFSGKPVVGKTRIPTQGGQGSITIMRTRG